MLINPPPDFFVKAVWALLTLLLLLIIYYLINIGNNFIPEKKRIRVSNSKLIPLIGVLLILYFISFIMKRYTLISDLFYTIILSAILAYILNPLVFYFEKKGMKRLYGVITVYLIILGLLFILAFLVVPNSSREIGKLINNLPDYIENMKTFVAGINEAYKSSMGNLPPIFSSIEKSIVENITRIESILGTGITRFVEGFIKSISRIISYILTPVLTFYFLVDKEFFKSKIKEAIPYKHKDEVLNLAGKIDESISLFLRGRLLMAAFVGVSTSIFLMIMGIDFAIVIGFITMIADIIPYIGPFLGFMPAVIFAFIASPIKALWVGLFFIIIQWVENNIVGPKILGDSTGMHPLTILLAIIVGGAVFGVMGMIISVPLISILKIFYFHFRDKLRERKI